MAELRGVRGSAVSAALHRLGFVVLSNRAAGDRQGIVVSGSGKGVGVFSQPAYVSARYHDLTEGWEVARTVAAELATAGWTVELKQPPGHPGVRVTAGPVRGKSKKREAK